MTGVESLFIYWLGRHNLGPGKQFQQIYRRGKLPGRISLGTWTGCFISSFIYDHPQDNKTISLPMKVLQSGSIKFCKNNKESFTVDLIDMIPLSFRSSSWAVLSVRVLDRASLTGGHIAKMTYLKL